MNDFYFASHVVTNAIEAEEYFDTFCSDIKFVPGALDKFNYSTRFCMLGESFVSSSASTSGWGYEARAEYGGILITIPQQGVVTWSNQKERFNSRVGFCFLADQREIRTSSYSANSHYLTIYLSLADMHRYLTLLIGGPPKSELFFTKKTSDQHGAKFLSELVNTILHCAAQNTVLARRPISHLKECLISYVLLNIDNNHTSMLKTPSAMLRPTPYSIKKVTDYIEFNYDKNLTVSDLAVHAGISIRALQLGFKQFKNTTPMNYLRAVRLANARAMLADVTSLLSTKEIAIRCGFTNYYLFCKYYAITYHEPPGRVSNIVY